MKAILEALGSFHEKLDSQDGRLARLERPRSTQPEQPVVTPRVPLRRGSARSSPPREEGGAIGTEAGDVNDVL